MHPHALDDGLKLVEQAGSGTGGIGSALILLLTASNGYSDGDFDEGDQSGVTGRWSGDRGVIVGVYAEPEDLAPKHEAELVYDFCGTRADVSKQTAHLIDYARRGGQEEYAERVGRLKEREPYTDITPRARDYLEREEVAIYGEVEGWIPHKLPY